MITSILWIKDIEGFWKRHAQSKAALHEWLLSSLGKKELQRRLETDIESLKNARIVTSDGKA